MKIVIVLPRNMHFGPRAASSIDLCVRDAVLYSRYRDKTVVICQENDDLFKGLDIRTYPGGSTRQRVRAISRIIRDIDPGLIVAHQHLPSAGALARRFTQIPVLLHKHNFIDPVTWFRRQRRYRQLNRLAGIIFVTNTCRDGFVDAFPGAQLRSFVAHNGLLAADWPARPEKAPEIVAVGRVEAMKGSIEIAEALARVLPDYPDWRARFIGPITTEPDYADRFRAVIAGTNRIEYTGPLPFGEVATLTRRAEIALVNSRKEAFGRVAIEAFAGEAALISSIVGGLREVVGDATLVLAEGNTAEIEGHLRSLLGDGDMRHTLAQAGRQRFDANFTMVKAAADLDSIYASFLTR